MPVVVLDFLHMISSTTGINNLVPVLRYMTVTKEITPWFSPVRNVSRKSWNFPRIPENHSPEFPEDSLALICTNIPENSRGYIGIERG